MTDGSPGTTTTYRASVHDAIRDVDAAKWDAAVAAAGAPALYRWQVLKAYEDAPLGEHLRVRYLCFEGAADSFAAVLPIYVTEYRDPLGVLARAFPDVPSSARLLLTHVWHWYDTCFPARGDLGGLLPSLRAALVEVAEQERAEWVAFVNMAESSALPEALAGLGMTRRQVERRFQLDVEGMRTTSDYLTKLRKLPRRNLRRDVARAEAQGVEIRVNPPAGADVDAVVDMCRHSAGRHGHPDYYPRDRLTRFLEGAGDSVRIVEVRAGGDVIAASVCLLDDHRFHTWIGGADYTKGEGFSPNYVLFHAEVSFAIEAPGVKLMEGGRRNDAFKLRYGLTPLPLYACAGRARDLAAGGS